VGVTSPDTPVKVGTTRQLHIERLVAGGESMARDTDGRVVFVDGALPDETVEVEFTEVKRDFARARLRRVQVATANRVTPPCAHVADGCGGCNWQHLAASAQHDAKVDIVREAFARTGRLPEARIVRGASGGTMHCEPRFEWPQPPMVGWAFVAVHHTMWWASSTVW
jgi:23S rRNA (uracil1939-C5)-methyltransferase